MGYRGVGSHEVLNNRTKEQARKFAAKIFTGGSK